jgi:transcriptional antiterminator RfaH
MLAPVGQPSWYVLHTKPREELRADSNLRAWGVETLMPRFLQPVYRPSTGATARVIKALFPQYLFARFNLPELLIKIRFTRGVHEVVNVGGEAAPVHEDIIAMIRDRIGKNGLVHLDIEFSPGDRVLIQSGLLRGFTGVFQCDQNDSRRVAILLDALRCQARVIIERDRLRKDATLSA